MMELDDRGKPFVKNYSVARFKQGIEVRTKNKRGDKN
jgi:hypothetical protein